ncbi:MAG: hypothetical protein HYY63_02385 [Elusimicrobia bacterium]|nr:hypothetical protein [Elusimicrobiota bacterium]
MRVEFKSSFKRSLKSLHSLTREDSAKEVVKKFILAIENKDPISPGFGLTKLKKNYYEIRSGLFDRIMFRRQKDLMEFIIVGDHNDIKRFLKVI